VEIGPTNRDHRRKPEDEATLRRLAASYRGGASIRTLCTETGWAYGTVHRRIAMAERAGLLTMRPRGGARIEPQA
jgi:transposase